MIGGPLDYQRLAEWHRPQDPNQIATECRRLTARDIAQALRISHIQVHTLLQSMTNPTESLP